MSEDEYETDCSAYATYKSAELLMTSSDCGMKYTGGYDGKWSEIPNEEAAELVDVAIAMRLKQALALNPEDPFPDNEDGAGHFQAFAALVEARDNYDARVEAETANCNNENAAGYDDGSGDADVGYDGENGDANVDCGVDDCDE